MTPSTRTINLLYIS